MLLERLEDDPEPQRGRITQGAGACAGSSTGGSSRSPSPARRSRSSSARGTGRCPLTPRNEGAATDATLSGTPLALLALAGPRAEGALRGGGGAHRGRRRGRAEVSRPAATGAAGRRGGTVARRSATSPRDQVANLARGLLDCGRQGRPTRSPATWPSTCRRKAATCRPAPRSTSSSPAWTACATTSSASRRASRASNPRRLGHAKRRAVGLTDVARAAALAIPDHQSLPNASARHRPPAPDPARARPPRARRDRARDAPVPAAALRRSTCRRRRGSSAAGAARAASASASRSRNSGRSS